MRGVETLRSEDEGQGERQGALINWWIIEAHTLLLALHTN